MEYIYMYFLSTLKLKMLRLIILSIYLTALVESIIDISWDFNTTNFNEEWNNDSSADNSGINLYTTSGELRGIIKRKDFYIDSPKISLDIISKSYCLIRMNYHGQATTGQLLLQSGPDKPADSLDNAPSSWSLSRLPTQISTTSLPLYGTNVQNIIDSNSDTYFQTTWIPNNTISFTFNLQSIQWISSFSIIPYGDNMSPKTCILQKALTSSESGPYTTITTFTVLNKINSDNEYEPTSIYHINTYAQYWRLIIQDNYGNTVVGIRDIAFHGFHDSITVVPFSLINTGIYHTYNIPIFEKMRGVLTRIRIQFDYSTVIVGTQPQIASQNNDRYSREVLAIDYIRLVQTPFIWRIRGCLDIYYDNPNYERPVYNVTTIITRINDNLPLYSYIQTSYLTQESSTPIWYSKTIDCPLRGGIDITLDGIDFGDKPNIYIDDKLCIFQNQEYVEVGSRVSTVTCTLPVSRTGRGMKMVRVEDSIHRGLYYEVPLLSYQVQPEVPFVPIIEYIRATAMDICWEPPGRADIVQQLVITGYQIIWQVYDMNNTNPSLNSYNYKSNNTNTTNMITPPYQYMTVGNITCTTIRGLQPSTPYRITIASISEGSGYLQYANLSTDLYGRRELSNTAILSNYSLWTNVTYTSAYDIYYNGLLSSPNILNNTPNDMNITKHTIISIGHQVNGMETTITNNLLNSASLVDISTDSAYTCINSSTLNCGPILRLTSSIPRQAGAAWYPLKVNIREGFDTQFTYIITSPSTTCDIMNDIHTFCRSRGGDGFAFVIQNDSLKSIGKSGMGLGYEGISNAIAIEFDTYMNYENLDVYENHIAVITNGWRYNITANHSIALATTTNGGDLTQNNHTIRIKYTPIFEYMAMLHPSFMTSGHTSWFLQNADFINGGQSDWSTGLGLLYIFMDDLDTPILTTIINIDTTLHLDRGGAYVGFTASTGDTHWQTHDILDWSFISLTLDNMYYPPLIVNNIGDYVCQDSHSDTCVHRTDSLHYTRTNYDIQPYLS